MHDVPVPPSASKLWSCNALTSHGIDSARHETTWTLWLLHVRSKRNPNWARFVPPCGCRSKTRRQTTETVQAGGNGSETKHETKAPKKAPKPAGTLQVPKLMYKKQRGAAAKRNESPRARRSPRVLKWNLLLCRAGIWERRRMTRGPCKVFHQCQCPFWCWLMC